MKLWKISFGNSSNGQIGMVCDIYADTKEEALEKFKELDLETVEIKDTVAAGHEAVDYINVYVNPDLVTLADVEEWDNGEEFAGSWRAVTMRQRELFFRGLTTTRLVDGLRSGGLSPSWKNVHRVIG